MVKSKDRWMEQENKTYQISLKIDALTNLIQSFLANLMVKREVGANPKGILTNPSIGMSWHAQHRIKDLPPRSMGF
jgi:hypothetical protein